eukprot:TRINITY_DN3704_c0_g3_i2.p1 TRINITY_DN3704_c0_g3~~TRINITY_DN3704_c0_g3_i2.p1  ORF type:complete len:409 (-),score=131.13 TRINITY_DN3704_c0_g3_i2:45-1271(-)
MVQAVFRHGARTPLHHYPNITTEPTWECEEQMIRVIGQDAYRKVYMDGRQLYKGNCHEGQLTPFGRKQLNLLGMMCRHRYVDGMGFIDGSMDPKEVVVRSTNIERTQISAQSLLSGLFPTKQRKEGVVMEIGTLGSVMETMFPRYSCQRYNEIRHLTKKLNEEETEASRGRQHLLVILRELMTTEGDTSMRKWTPKNFVSVHNTLSSVMVHGHKMPEEIDYETLDQAEFEALHDFARRFDGETGLEMCRVGIGRFIGEIKDKMDAKIEGKSDVKMALYAGHDSTLLPMMMALQLLDGQRYPQVASILMFELYRDVTNDKRFLRVVYNGKDMKMKMCPQYRLERGQDGSGNKVTKVTGVVPGNTENREEKVEEVMLCEWECATKFLEAVVIPKDYDVECGNVDFSKNVI